LPAIAAGETTYVADVARSIRSEMPAAHADLCELDEPVRLERAQVVVDLLPGEPYACCERRRRRGLVTQLAEQAARTGSSATTAAAGSSMTSTCRTSGSVA
jgi:hypothetical protein